MRRSTRARFALTFRSLPAAVTPCCDSEDSRNGRTYARAQARATCVREGECRTTRMRKDRLVAVPVPGASCRHRSLDRHLRAPPSRFELQCSRQARRSIRRGLATRCRGVRASRVGTQAAATSGSCSCSCVLSAVCAPPCGITGWQKRMPSSRSWSMSCFFRSG